MYYTFLRLRVSVVGIEYVGDEARKVLFYMKKARYITFTCEALKTSVSRSLKMCLSIIVLIMYLASSSVAVAGSSSLIFVNNAAWGLPLQLLCVKNITFNSSFNTNLEPGKTYPYTLTIPGASVYPKKCNVPGADSSYSFQIIAPNPRIINSNNIMTTVIVYKVKGDWNYIIKMSNESQLYHPPFSVTATTSEGAVT